jgi:NitT/TauT family transport system permease protein
MSEHHVPVTEEDVRPSPDRGPPHPAGVSEATTTGTTLPKSDIEELEQELVVVARRRMRRETITRLVSPVLVVVALTATWQIAVRAMEVPTYLVPAPTDVAETFADQGGILLSNSYTTLSAIFLGFLMAMFGGMLTALLTYFWKPFERGLYPLLVALQAVPKVAIAPLFAIWFGFSLTTRSLMAFLLAVFPVLISTLVGLRSIAPEKVLLARSIGLSPTKTFLKIRLPQALPSIFGGAKVALALSAVGAVVGEFIGGSAGLGYLINRANHDLNTPLLFAALTVLAVFAILFFLIIEALERALLPWHLKRDPTLTGA